MVLYSRPRRNRQYFTYGGTTKVSKARPGRLLGAVAAAIVAVGALGPGVSARTSLANPPPGANNFSCKPSAAHPDPVVLVHGLGATMGENWRYMSPLLAARGYCVFALTYGIDPRFPMFGGTIPIEQSAGELRQFVDKVLESTGAANVDLVGHSEGTFMPQYWLKFLGGASKVSRYVAMTPLYAGTNLLLFGTLEQLGGGQPPGGFANFCGSCAEFLAGSPMVKKLNAGGAAVPGVAYTTIMTRYDELVAPYTSGYLHAPNAKNHVLQDICPNDTSEHNTEAVDPVVAQLIFNALDPAHARPISCAGLPPLLAPPPPGP
ncbi:MAG TPA: alpha/beta fold hydrolase [Acidimicrobiales bacterium]